MKCQCAIRLTRLANDFEWQLGGVGVEEVQQIPHMLWSVSRHQYFSLLHDRVFGLEYQ